jgi:hypothetical protein
MTHVSYRRLPEGWQEAFVDDVRQGRYYETTITHPALFFVARDLDLERLKQFSPKVQRELRKRSDERVPSRSHGTRRTGHMFESNGWSTHRTTSSWIKPVK